MTNNENTFKLIPRLPSPINKIKNHIDYSDFKITINKYPSNECIKTTLENHLKGLKGLILENKNLDYINNYSTELIENTKELINKKYYQSYSNRSKENILFNLFILSAISISNNKIDFSYITEYINFPTSIINEYNKYEILDDGYNEFNEGSPFLGFPGNKDLKSILLCHSEDEVPRGRPKGKCGDKIYNKDNIHELNIGDKYKEYSEQSILNGDPDILMELYEYKNKYAGKINNEIKFIEDTKKDYKNNQTIKKSKEETVRLNPSEKDNNFKSVLIDKVEYKAEIIKTENTNNIVKKIFEILLVLKKGDYFKNPKEQKETSQKIYNGYSVWFKKHNISKPDTIKKYLNKVYWYNGKTIPLLFNKKTN